MINSIPYQNNAVSFGSSFKATDTLQRLFDDVKSGVYSKQERYEIARSVKSILNDGKNDVVELVKENKNWGSQGFKIRYIIAKVNGKNAVESNIPAQNYISTSYTIGNVIEKLAKKRNRKLDFESLSEQDIKTIAPQMKKLEELIKNNKDVPTKLFAKINALKGKMNEKLSNKAVDYICNIETKIFGK